MLIVAAHVRELKSLARLWIWVVVLVVVVAQHQTTLAGHCRPSAHRGNGRRVVVVVSCVGRAARRPPSGAATVLFKEAPSLSGQHLLLLLLSFFEREREKNGSTRGSPSKVTDEKRSLSRNAPRAPCRAAPAAMHSVAFGRPPRSMPQIRFSAKLERAVTQKRDI